MLNEVQLKEKLQVYAQQKFRPLENDDLTEMIPDLLNHIGTTDSSLRDDLIYTAFATWILRYNAIDQEQLRNLLPTVLDDQHMLYRIGEQNTNSVFTRSFSVLLLPLLLIAHRSHPFLTTSEIYQIKETLLYYLGNEKDRRGYVSESGWAHSIAHAADALDDLAQCTEMTEIDLREILVAIRAVVSIQDVVYTYGEDERLVTPALAVIKRSLLPDPELIDWIEGFAACVLEVNSTPERTIIRANIKNFLQSLYFRLQWEQVTNKLEAAIDQTLQKINPFVRAQGG